MMDTKNIIREYCIIRDGEIILNGNVLFKSSERAPSLFFPDAYKNLGINYSRFYKMDNLSKLGFLASELLLSGKTMGEFCKADEMGLIFYNAASSADTDRVHQESINDRGAYFPSPSVFVYTLANIVIGEICIRHKIYGESTFFIEKEFNPHGLYQYVSRLLEDHIVQCCLTGWIQLDGEQYEGMLYLIEKSASDTDGIAIFEPEKLKDIYLQEA
jgi:hypothetical protein